MRTLEKGSRDAVIAAVATLIVTAAAAAGLGDISMAEALEMSGAVVVLLGAFRVLRDKVQGPPSR